MELVQNLNPSKEDINKAHAEFCKNLTDLFEKHKSKYIENGGEDVFLVIE